MSISVSLHERVIPARGLDVPDIEASGKHGASPATQEHTVLHGLARNPALTLRKLQAYKLFFSQFPGPIRG